MVLDWVGHHSGAIDINPEEHEFLGLLSVRQTDVSMFIISAEEFTPRGILYTPPMSNYYLDIVIYGENFKPQKRIIKFTVSTQYDNMLIQLQDD